MRTRLVTLTTAIVLTGCAPPIPDGGFNAPDPASRVYALVRLVRSYRGPHATHSGSPSASQLKPVVIMLDSDDPMERFMASDALLELTGKDMGYQPAAPLPVRAQAVERWKEWLLAQPDQSASNANGDISA